MEKNSALNVSVSILASTPSLREKRKAATAGAMKIICNDGTCVAENVMKKERKEDVE